jgi:hypothetical protein
MTLNGTTVNITHNDSQPNVKLSVAFFHYYATFCNTECHFAKCRGTTVPASVQVGNANLSTIFLKKPENWPKEMKGRDKFAKSQAKHQKISRLSA